MLGRDRNLAAHTLTGAMQICMASCNADLTPFPAPERALERFSEALVIGSGMGRSKTAVDAA